MQFSAPGLFIWGLLFVAGRCSDSHLPMMCDSPQKELSCLVDPYFQYKCKEACKSFKHLEKEVGGYPELFSLPALALMNSKGENKNSGDSDCQDIAPYCHLITMNIGGFYKCSLSALTRYQCPKSCGVCSSSKSTVSVRSETAAYGETPVTGLENPKIGLFGTCRDLLPICKSLYAQYACLNDFTFKKECPVTCGLCTPGELDNTIVESELSSSVGRHAPTPKLQPGEHCSDKLPICLTVYAQYACLNDPHFVRECPVTCGLCQPSDDTSSDLIEGCRDVSNAFCMWVTDSMCGFMDIRMQCPAKCGLCASETSESKLELVKENEFLEAASDYDYDESNATTTAAPQTSSSSEEPDECEDVLPAFICKAFWAHFACADDTSDFRYKCEKSCGFCPSHLLTTTEASETCKDEFPNFVCKAYWAKFACANHASGFYRKCQKSCGYCCENEEDLLDEEMNEELLDFNEKSESVQKLEALLAHYYLKLEQVAGEVFDYESKQICGSEYMKKFGCAHDAVASVFCKETCMNVITQLVKTPVSDSHAPLMSFFQMDGLDENGETEELEGTKIGTSVSTVVGGCLGVVALVSVILGVTLKVFAHRRSQRQYSKL